MDYDVKCKRCGVSYAYHINRDEAVLCADGRCCTNDIAFVTPTPRDEAAQIHAAFDNQRYEQLYGSPTVRKLFFTELARAVCDELQKRKENDK